MTSSLASSTVQSFQESLKEFVLDDIERPEGKPEAIGEGSYAVVIPLHFRGLKCAGKKLSCGGYGITASNQERLKMIERFQKECKLLSGLKHPNIVQFLGLHVDHVEKGSEIPVLVMELLHCTLAEYVEGSASPIVLRDEPKLYYSIFNDVITGLRYLHEHKPRAIIHRDLSANNVLLSLDMRAKISDLGVAKILNLTPKDMSRFSGTLTYMPPEAMGNEPKYDATLDCFSMGVLMLHVLCGQWPRPEVFTKPNPKNPNELIFFTEEERRAQYFATVKGGKNHPLCEIICKCLQNVPEKRPKAKEIHLCLQEKASSQQLRVSSVSKIALLNEMSNLKSRKQAVSEELEQLKTESKRETQRLRAQVHDREKEKSDLAEKLQKEFDEKIACKDEENKGLNEQIEKTQDAWKAKLRENNDFSEKLQKQLQKMPFDSIEMEQAQRKCKELATEVEGLKNIVQSKEKVVQAKTHEMQQAVKAKEAEIKMAIQVKETEMKKKILAKEREKQQAIRAKDAEKQQAIRTIMAEKQQAIEVKDTEKQQAIEAKEAKIQQLIQAKAEITRGKDKADQDVKLMESRVIQLRERQNQIRQEKETEKEQAIKAVTAQVTETLEMEKELAIQQKEEIILAKETTIESKDLKIRTMQMTADAMKTENESKESLIKEKDFTIGNMKQQMTELKSYLSRDDMLHPFHPQTTLAWRRCTDMPKTVQHPRSVLIGEKVFVAGNDSHDVISYDTTHDSWYVLEPTCPVKNFGLGAFSGKLITVGGKSDDGKLTSDVYTFLEEEKKWVNSIKPMPTPRALPSVVGFQSCIAVCGGRGSSTKEVKRLVEVFDKEASEWYTTGVDPLPASCVSMPVLMIKNTCYFGGNHLSGHKHVLCTHTPLPSIGNFDAQDGQKPSLNSRSAQKQVAYTWLPDLPKYGSALASMGGVLLAIGGRENGQSPPCDSIDAYVPSTKTWVTIGALPRVRYDATAERLPSGEVMLIGGVDGQKSYSKALYIGTLEL